MILTKNKKNASESVKVLKALAGFKEKSERNRQQLLLISSMVNKPAVTTLKKQ